MNEERFRPSELQIKILEKLLQGTTDAAIGRALRIADRTVRLHISRLQTVSRVRGRFALGAVAHAKGWIEIDGCLVQAGSTAQCGPDET
jgi:DNA-binding NarL/FixJ family response regulator